jgi:hypothetical protein
VLKDQFPSIKKLNDELKVIGPWRQTPVPTGQSDTVGTEMLAVQDILTSARQGLTEAVSHFGLGREAYVGIPDYSGHCVIDFIGRKTNPVPLRFLPPDECSAVLLYDQWGWQKSSKAREFVRGKFPNANLLWDRVDSLPLCFADIAKGSEHEAEIQVFSLAKTLGADGGGLVWVSGEGWLQGKTNTDGRLMKSINDLREAEISRSRAWELMDRFMRGECNTHTPKFSQWFNSAKLADTIRREYQHRIARGKICAEFLGEDSLPVWMRCVLEDSTVPAPGIFPYPVADRGERFVERLNERFGLELAIYNFNFLDNYIEPDWKKVLAVPLHSEIDIALLRGILGYIA